jgi:hypothetical protein
MRFRLSRVRYKQSSLAFKPCNFVVGFQHFGGTLHPEDAGSMGLPQNYMASQPRKPP